MGRGLRIPENWLAAWGQPKVLIFNHANWANRVRSLVDEVLEYEKRITTKILQDSEHNFTLTNVSYNPEKQVVKTEKSDPYNWLEKGYVDLSAKTKEHDASATIVNIKDGTESKWSTRYSSETFTVDEIAEMMFSKFEDLPQYVLEKGKGKGETLTEYYQKLWPVDRLKKMIERSLNESGNSAITKELKTKFIQSLGTLHRTGNKALIYTITPDVFSAVDTKEMRTVSVNASALKGKSALFYTSITGPSISEEEKEFFNEVIDTVNGYRHEKIDNLFDFKTPQSAVITDSKPEADFIRKLVSPEISPKISKWIKSANTKFYSFNYTWRKGEHPQNNDFNPDLFLLTGNRIIVVEIKDDTEIQEPSPDNKGKWRAAIKHFAHINTHLKSGCKEHGELDIEDLRYKFTMITPSSFEAFFERILSGDTTRIDNFKSDLDDAIGGSAE
jgi:type III restriction enzyme